MTWTDRIGRRIKLSDLHVFLTVAQTGSMARAATQLSVSNPVVSRAVAQLEHALGVRLMDRSPKGIELTEFGRALALRSHGAFDELRQGVKDIEGLQDPTVGDVRIGTTPTLAASFVSAVLIRLNRKYPRIRAQVIPGEAEPQIQLLEERHLDLLIHRRIEDVAAAKLDFEELFQSPYVIAAGSHNPLTRRRNVQLSALVDQPWVLPPLDRRFGGFLAAAFKAHDLPYPSALIITTALEMRANLLRTGRYLTMVPEFWLRFPDRHPYIKKIAVDLPRTGTPVGILSLNGRSCGAAGRQLSSVAREVALLVDQPV